MALLKPKDPVVLSYRWDNPTIEQNTPFEEQKFLLLKIRPIELPPPPRVNLVLVLDKSGSMEGEPIENLKKAVKEILNQLEDEDRISIVLFDSEARVLVSNTPASARKELRTRVEDIFPLGGTSIDEGMELGLQEAEKFLGEDVVTWMILLTDGKNDHGDNNKCIELARVARKKGINISTIGLGRKWDPKLLEQISDFSGGKMYYVDNPEDLKEKFLKELENIKNVVYRDISLKLKLEGFVEFSKVSPAFVVTPQIKRIEPLWDGEGWILEIGDLERDKEKLVLLQVFVGTPSSSYINKVMEYVLSYRTLSGERKESAPHNIVLEVTETYISQFDEEVRDAVSKVSLYVEHQIAEEYLDSGRPMEALTILQTMYQTAVKFENDDLKKVIEENIEKIKVQGEIPDELRIKTKYQTKLIEE
ncbi:MAG: VWA domain-containing protein [candidate division WOR-3 bacterium]